MSRRFSLLLLLLAACSMNPPAQTDASPRQEAPAPVPEPPAPVKPQPKPAPEPRSTPARPPIKADSICPPPAETETDQQKMIRKLDCLLERD